MNYDKIKLAIRPEKNETVPEVVTKLEKIGEEVFVGGSYAKETNLKTYDIDIFVRFKDETDISKRLGDFLNKEFEQVTLMHGSRDYYQVFYKGLDLEIIPVLKVDKPEDAKNITDMSPLHVTWVKKNINNLNDDVRLAKLFCKHIGVYGAESYINGFSGYILEILIIHYKGFENLLKASLDWKPNQIIDVENLWKGKPELNESKTLSPLIIIDPTQKNRNASAALNGEKFTRFILESLKFLNNPTIDYFKPKQQPSLLDLKMRSKKLNTEFITLRVEPKEGTKDYIGTKILKAYEKIKQHLELNEFTVLESGWQWDETCFFYYMVYPINLPKFKKHMGPVITANKKHIEIFLKKHPNIEIENFNIYALVQRKHTDPKELIKDIIQKNFIKDRVKEINLF